MLPYLKAQVQLLATKGQPFMRPAWYDFPEDPAAQVGGLRAVVVAMRCDVPVLPVCHPGCCCAPEFVGISNLL